MLRKNGRKNGATLFFFTLFFPPSKNDSFEHPKQATKFEKPNQYNALTRTEWVALCLSHGMKAPPLYHPSIIEFVEETAQLGWFARLFTAYCPLDS